MVETFLSGFAKGFIDARKDRMDREADTENQQFKYKMDSLMQMREKREAKSLKEKEMSDQAKGLSDQFGDPNFAPVAMQELKLGVSAETVQERLANGYYTKNTSYKPPTQTLKVPAAVSMKFDAGMDDTQPTGTGMLARGEAVNKQRGMDKVNARIDAIDPSLRQGMVDQDTTSATTDEASNFAYKYTPKNQVKLGSYEDALYAQQKAKDSNDPVALREANTKVKIWERVNTENTINQAKARGKNSSTFLSIGDDGVIKSQLPGEVRDNGDGTKSVWNIADPQNEQQVSGRVRVMNKDDMDRYNAVTDQFSKKSDDYKVAAGAYVSALDSSQRMAQILHNDRGAATYASKGLGLVAELQGEAQAAYQSINGLETTINEKAASGKLDGIEKDIADHAKAVDEFVKNSMMTPGNQQKVVNAAMYNSLKMQTAYQVAQATSTDGKVSNNDLNNAMQIIGNSSDPDQILPALNTQMQGAFLKLTSAQTALESNDTIKNFERDYQLKTGLRPDRVGDMIMKSNLPDEQKRNLLNYQNEINKVHQAGQAQVNQSVQEQQVQQVQPPAQTQTPPKMVTITDPEKFNAATAILKKNPSPEMKLKFDKVFGQGASDQVLK
jgi:hypothetical protein